MKKKKMSQSLSLLLSVMLMVTSLLPGPLVSFAADPSAPDALSPPTLETLANPGFETWPEDASALFPEGWGGSTSSSGTKMTKFTHPDPSAITEFASGTYAAQLDQVGTTAKRYATQGYYVVKDRVYTVDYWVKGVGSIRNANGVDTSGYTYSAYTLSSPDLWTHVTYQFTAKATTAGLQLVFGVKDGNGSLLLDAVSITGAGGEVETKVKPVTATPAPGAVDKDSLVSLSTLTMGAVIHFTTDGTPATAESPVYTTPITITDAMTISAIGVKEGLESSDLGTLAYTLKAPLPAQPTPIADARAILAGKDKNFDSKQEVYIEGVISDIYGGGRNVAIQDMTAGVIVRLPANNPNLAVGKTITVKGNMVNYSFLAQVSVADPTNVVVKDAAQAPVTPKVLTSLKGADLELLEGQRVIGESLTIKANVTATGNYTVIGINGSGDEIALRVENPTQIPAATFVAGQRYHATGTLAQYSASQDLTGYQIILIDPAMVTLDSSPDTAAPVVEHTPADNQHITKDWSVSAKITDNRGVTAAELYYKAVGAAEFTKLSLVASGSNYMAVVPASALKAEGMVYYFTATDGTNAVTYPTDTTKPFVRSIDTADIAGPSVTKFVPADGTVVPSANAASGIRAEFADPSGIDVKKVSLTLDTVDVTASATIKGDSISYKPDAALAEGGHTAVVKVTDSLGNETTKSWNFSVGKQTFNYYYGQLHSHTTLSDGQGTVEEAYTWARDKGKADFFAVTDHSNWFDNDTNWTLSTKWKQLKDTAASFNNDGSFVALSGYEMTWSGSTGGWGHINTFNTDWFKSRTDKTMDLKNYYAEIAKDTASISQLNHPGKTFGDFADFGYYTEAADNVVKLVEVGNGEGPVRGSGYFPSYEYYTRALDKGWHVAPSNNQDNHKANWVTANEARTVMVAETLTKDSVLDAMRKLHVFSSEDKNLEVMYTVNGQVMGATLTSPEKLSFNISVKDQDSEDKIAKISIIADGGTVVTSKTFDAAEANWQFELPPVYKYYYVRVDQADKDIAVTAPVWTGTVLPVGISTLKVSQNPVVTGSPVNLTATLYNNGATLLPNAKLEFYVGSISGDNKIGEAEVSNILPAAMAAGTISYTPTTAGEKTIIVTMTTQINGETQVFNSSVNLTVGNPGELTKIVLDASHQNGYVSGSYAGKMVNLKEFGKANKYMIVENTQAITAQTLADASILIMTDPQSVDKAPLTKQVYSDDEVAAIKAFVEAGGSLIITSAADYGDGLDQYGSAAQSNKVLEALGSNMRFNDDQVIDATTNGGQPYRLYFTNYTGSKYGLTNGLDQIGKYSFYSGNSVMVKNGGSDAAIDWLVSGFATTESSDADKKGDNTPIAKGDVKAIGAEILPGGGKVVAAGTSFFSDFETEINDNAYSNLELTKRLIAWLVPVQNVTVSTVAQVRADANADGKPDNFGKTMTVEGYVTAQSEAVSPKNAFFEVIYVQDATGGLTVFGVSQTALAVGTKVRITGTVGQYENDAQLALSNETKQLVVLDSPNMPVTPKILSTADAMKEVNEGWLVETRGVVTRIVTEGDNAIYINDGSGEARIYLNGYIGDGTGNQAGLGKWNPAIQVGDTVKAIGLAAEDMGGHRIRVRNTLDIQLVKPAEKIMTIGITPSADGEVLEGKFIQPFGLTIQNANKVNVVEFEFEYDQTKLEYVTISQSTKLNAFVQYKEFGNKVRITMMFPEPLKGDGVIALGELFFNLKPTTAKRGVATVTLVKALGVVSGDTKESSFVLNPAVANLNWFNASKLADTNEDGVINLVDLSYFLDQYKKTSTSSDWATVSKMDFNQDGEINITDVLMMMSYFSTYRN